jgi:hypothetical protein
MQREGMTMFDYIHNTQGRLRVRIASLKANGTGARNLQIALQRIPGVRSVDINLLTGSVLILHDGVGATFEAVAIELSVFAQSELAAAMKKPAHSQIAQKAAILIMWHLAESALERLVIASLTVLL